jgi:hypothetical protein
MDMDEGFAGIPYRLQARTGRELETIRVGATVLHHRHNIPGAEGPENCDACEILRLRTHLEELEHEIQRLPVPPAGLGDGPQERVGHALTVIHAAQQYVALWRIVHEATPDSAAPPTTEDRFRLGYVRGALFAAVAALEASHG